MRNLLGYQAKGKEIFIGLEDSKRTWKICVRSEGEIIDQVSMPAKYEVLIKYLMRAYPECKIKVMYEAGFHGFWLHDLLESEGIECIVTPPNLLVMEKQNKVKTDKRDARRIAKNLENVDYVSCYVPDQELREDRQISRVLNQIQKKVISTKNQIRRFLEFHGLDREMRAGAWSNIDYEKLRELKLSDSLLICLTSYLDTLSYLQKQQLKLTKELKKLSQKERYQKTYNLFTGVYGIGFLTAIRFVLEWGDMRRFKSRSRFSSYLGFTPSEYSSGDTVHKGRITKQGNRYVRRWLVECAWLAKRRDPVLHMKYKRVLKSCGCKKKAIVATARKLALRLRYIALTEEPYCIGLIN